LQWTIDVPSNHQTSPDQPGRMPVLDLQVGMDGRRVTFEFYQKPMATRYTIPARSAHSWQIKRSTLIQEGVRRLLNTAPMVEDSRKKAIMESWDSKMRTSGYDESFRRQTISAAVGIYRAKVAKAEAEGIPLYRARSWEKERRQMEKDLKICKWYESRTPIPNIAPLIINPTMDGFLKEEADKICSLFKETHGMGIKIMQRGGRKATAEVASDPKGSKLCQRPNCMICTAPDSKGGCRGQGMGYTQTCLRCPNGKGMEKDSSVYFGETGRSNYERGVSHLRDLASEKEDTPLWKHCELIHEGEHVEFKMESIGSFPNCEERQITEGSQVKVKGSLVKHILNSKSEWNQPPIFRITTDSGNVNVVQGGMVPGVQGAGTVRGGRGRGGRAGRRGRGVIAGR
jgi:hypothetical protein